MAQIKDLAELDIALLDKILVFENDGSNFVWYVVKTLQRINKEVRSNKEGGKQRRFTLLACKFCKAGTSLKSEYTSLICGGAFLACWSSLS